eukprot:augustus_masked-scaffold_3-processed-gene-13.57-mRNA-1 protein AED:1.00 eAED:1.00 QI:0/-1/0/0/-1/1/1/0/171
MTILAIIYHPTRKFLGREEMTQVASETEPTSAQHLQEIPNFTSRRKVNVQVLSLNVGGLAQYKLSTIVKLSYELRSLLILPQEFEQNGVEKLEKANKSASQNGKERWFVSQADSNSTGVAIFVYQELLLDVTDTYRVSGRILAIKIMSSKNKQAYFSKRVGTPQCTNHPGL